MATEDTWHSMALAFSFRTLSRLQTYFSVSAPTGFLCILGYGPSFVVTGLLRLQASSPLCEDWVVPDKGGALSAVCA